MAVRAADGGPRGPLAAFTDVCGRRQAEAEPERLVAAEQEARRSLADHAERLSCPIASAVPGVLITGDDGLIAQASESFGALFGVEFPDRLAGQPPGQVLCEIRHVLADPGGFVRRMSEAFRVRQPVTGQRIACADGRTLECDYWPVLADGRYRGDIWVVRDVSERTAREEARLYCLATVSHELRTPLTAIVSFTEHRGTTFRVSLPAAA